MTRPPQGTSFAQFFPNAPKVRAEVQTQTQTHIDSEIQRPRLRAEGSDASENFAVLSDTYDRHTRESSSAAVSSSRIPVDEGDSPAVDIPSTVDSASSHASSASSIFSNPAKRAPINPSPGPSLSSSNLDSAVSLDHQSLSTSSPSYINRSRAHGTSVPTSSISNMSDISSSKRMPARDPHPSVKGLKCTYDPLLDRTRSKSSNKHATPTYSEFGLVRTYICLLDTGRGGVMLLSNNG